MSDDTPQQKTQDDKVPEEDKVTEDDKIDQPTDKTQDDNISEDDKIDKPTDTKHLDANKDIILQIEDNVQVQKVSEVEQLKQAVFRDQGLQSVYVIAGKGKKHRSKRNRNDGDHYSNRQIWVQALFGDRASGAEMDEGSRGPFVRKVFAILFFCMLFTSIFASMSFFMPDIRLFFKSPGGLLLVCLAIIVLIPINYAISCSDCTRVPPCNFICLVIAVICFTIIFMFVTALYSLKLVFTALFVTTLVVLLCFLLAFTPIDFTKFYIYVIVFLFVLIAFSFIIFFLMIVFNQKFTIIRLIISFGMTFFQSVLFIIQIQMVLGGKTIELGEDDYVLGAYMLYTSIIELFFEILKLLALLEDLDI